MRAARVAPPADKVPALAKQDVSLPAGNWPGGGWIEWPTGKRLAGGNTVHRSFSIEQTPVYLKEGAIVPMQPPMGYTGQKPVDPLIINVWPLSPGSSSNYSVYEDSGISVDYQHGVFTRTPIKATQTADTLRIEIRPVQGSFPGMIRNRSYELRLPADSPPERVAVNGAAVVHAGPTGPTRSTGKAGWTFEGNTLTTVIPVPASSVATRVTIEVHPAPGIA